MEKYIEVMKKSLELSETILEGLLHIQKNLNNGKIEQTVFLFEDVVEAYAMIESTIEPVLKELSNDNIATYLAKFSKSTELVVSAYEEENYAKVQEILQFTLVPQFYKLKEKLEEIFKPYVVS